MPRRGKVQRRPLAPDPRYNSEMVTRFINKIMQRGKKGLAERILYGALDIITERTGRNPLEVFEQAVQNATPVIEVKPRRVGGATYQVPVQIDGPRRHLDHHDRSIETDRSQHAADHGRTRQRPDGVETRRLFGIRLHRDRG